jgi:hypothetical protein
MSDTSETADVDTATDATVPAAETPTDAPQVDNQPDTADAAETPDSDDSSDVFPRPVVEKLRRESAGLRDRIKASEERVTASEERVTALQKQIVDRQVRQAGMRPEAVWAVTELADLLADDGTVDVEKVRTATGVARQTLGIRYGDPHRGHGFRSGATNVGLEPPARGFETAFRPREK